jgi:hypothetical protein
MSITERMTSLLAPTETALGLSYTMFEITIKMNSDGIRSLQ